MSSRHHRRLPRPAVLTAAISLALAGSSVAHAAEFIVQTTGDSGGGAPTETSPGVYTIDTLRSAVEESNSAAFAGADRIVFDPALLAGAPITINLDAVGGSFDYIGQSSNSALEVTDELEIDGGIRGDVVLQAGSLRHFQVAGNGDLRLQSLVLADGETPANISGRGGAVVAFGGGALELVDSEVTGCVADTGGGIAIISASSGRIERSRLAGNSTLGDFGSGTGGAIFAEGYTQVVDSLLENNDANYSGGGLFSTGQTVITGTTISGNTGRRGGGGLASNNVADVIVRNSTVSGNRAEANGGGIRVGSGPFQIINSTIVDNQAGTGWAGGGIRSSTPTSARSDSRRGNYGDNPLMHNTIVAGNTVGDGGPVNDVDGDLADASSNNVIGVDSGLSGTSDGVNGNQVGTVANPLDPRIGLLETNGGPTRTHALEADSPAIDAANNTFCPTSDQRGLSREPGACDVGAFERLDLIFSDRFRG